MGCRELEIEDYFHFVGTKRMPEKSHSRVRNFACTQKNAYSRFSHTVISNYRYYSPELGRWLSRDPIGEETVFNLYAMCNNDVLNWWDELGNWISQKDRKKMMEQFERQWGKPVLRHVEASCSCTKLRTFVKAVNDVLKDVYDAQYQSWEMIRKYFLEETYLTHYNTDKRLTRKINGYINQMFRLHWVQITKLYAHVYDSALAALKAEIARAEAPPCRETCTFHSDVVDNR